MKDEKMKAGHGRLMGGGWQNLRFLTAALAVLAVLSAFLFFPREAGAQNPYLQELNITPTSVQLRLWNSGVNWWYQDVNANISCTGGNQNNPKTVTGLQPNTSYSFAAFSDSSCSNRLTAWLDVTTTKVTLTAEKSGNYYSAKLTISNWNSAWWYRDARDGAQCVSVPAGTTTATVSNLSAGTAYNYTAHGASPCSTTNVVSNNVVFSTPGVSAGDITGTSVSLTIKNWNKDWWYGGVPDKTTVIPTGAECTKVSAGTSKASVTGLLQGVTYNFTAYSKEGCTVNAYVLGYAPLVQTTVPTGQPERVSKFWAQAGSSIGWIKLTWERPSGWNITSYSVKYKKRTQQSWSNVQSVSGTSTSHTFSGEPATVYDVGIHYYVKPNDKSTDTKQSMTAYSYARSRGHEPDKPTGVTATPGLRNVAVSWNKVPSGGNFTVNGYRVAWVSGDFNHGYCPYPAPGPCISPPDKDIACAEVGSNTSSYTHSGLTAGKTYKFRVRAKGSNGEWGACSDVASAVALYPAPGTVTGVSVTRGVGNLSVGWNSVSGATGYKVQWKSGSEGWSSDRQNDETGTTSSITGLTAGTEHTVRVIATKTNSVDASPSSEVKGTPYAQTPGQVQALTVSAPARRAENVGKLELSWTAITGATGFHVQWKSGAQGWSSSRQKTLKTGSATAETLVELDNNTQYTVRVRAVKQYAQGHGAWSSEATGTTNPGPPGKATGVSVTPSVRTLSVSWTAVTGTSGYKVQWKSGSENWSSSRQNDETGTTSTISNLNSGTTYVVRVIAHNDDGDAAPSQTVTGVPKYTKPAKVAGVTVAVDANQLSVSWNSVSGAENYVLQWKSGTQNFDSSRQNTGSDPGHTITGLTAGTEHTVRVKATRRHADDGDWSDNKTGTPPAPKPNQVTGVKAESASGIVGGSWVAKLGVSWNSISQSSGYVVQWKSGQQNFGSSRQAEVTATTYTIATGLDAGTEYTVQVKAKRTHADDGPWSPTAKGTPKYQPLDPVEDLTIAPGTEQLTVSWTALTGASGYKVQWKSGQQGWDPDSREAVVTATTYIIQGLRGGVKYTVRVMATRDNADDGSPAQNNGTPNSPAAQGQGGNDVGGDGDPGGDDGTPGDGDDDAGCPDIAPYETAADVEMERDPDTLVEFVQEARVGVESILGEETDESEAIDRLVECFGTNGTGSGGDGGGMSARANGAWMSGSIYLFAITDGRKYFLAPKDSGLAGTHLNLVDDNGCDVAAEIIRAARGEELQCKDIGLMQEGYAKGFLQYLWDNPADPRDDSEPGYEDRGVAPGDSPKLSYVEGITDEGLMPDGVGMIILGSGYYPDWEPPGSGPQPPSSGGGDGGGGCAVAGTGGTFWAAGANLLAAALFLAFAASRRKNSLM